MKGKKAFLVGSLLVVLVGCLFIRYPSSGWLLDNKIVIDVSPSNTTEPPKTSKSNQSGISSGEAEAELIRGREPELAPQLVPATPVLAISIGVDVPVPRSLQRFEFFG